MIGWGTTYHLPIILGPRMSEDLGVPLEVIYGGLTIMLLVSAFLSPRIGAMIDRMGAGRFLISGSIFAATGLTLLANSKSIPVYAAAWLFFGLTQACMLGNAAFVALARVAGAQARRAISTMLLFTAANPFIFYPISAWLSGAVGWRSMCLIYAALHVCVGLPVQALIARQKPAARPAGSDEASEAELRGALPSADRRGAFWLIAIAFTGQAFVGWGLSPHMINILSALGVPAASAIFLASLHGPAQTAGRLIDFGSRGEMPPMTMGLIAATLAPIGLVVLIFGGQSEAAALLGIGLYGMSAGLNTVIRATIPLNLFGREAYGATLGKIALPMNIACAVAPILFAALISRVGPAESLLAAAGIAALVLGVMMFLARRTRAALSPASAAARA